MNSENFPKLLVGLEGLNAAQPLAPQIDGILKGLGASNHATDANFSKIGKQIKQCFSLDTVEAIELALQELEQKAPAEWIAEALNKMSTNSPIAMAGTLRKIQAGKSLDLSQCFAMELVLAKHWMIVGDFIEGIRALIIDKDNAPKWRYKKAELSPKELNGLLPELYPY
jgi:hypothetical protein